MGKKKKEETKDIRKLSYEVYKLYCDGKPQFELVAIFKDRNGKKWAEFKLRK